MVECPICKKTIEHIDMVTNQEIIFRLQLIKHTLYRPAFDTKESKEYRCPECKSTLTKDDREADLLISKDFIDKYANKCPHHCNAGVEVDEQEDYYAFKCIKCGLPIIAITKGDCDDK